MRRLGLLPTFALLSCLPISALGLVLGRAVADDSRARNLEAARQTALLSSHLGIQSHLDARAFEEGLSPAQRRALDESLEAAVAGGGIARLKIWAGDGTVVYSDDADLIGERFEPGHELLDALDGEVASEISHLDEQENAGERKQGRLLEVYVPVVFDGDPRPAGAFELYLPYEPIADAIRRDTGRLYLLLAAGLGLLWAVLFPIVGGASRRLRHQALHDALTELPNRALFNDRVDQAVASARRNGGRVAVMLMDLDQFKEVNDTLGHHSGDLLLREVGARLRATLREADTVARLGGDEFGVLLSDVADLGAVLATAQMLLDELKKPFLLDELPVEVAASVGIAAFPDHGDDGLSLLQRADVAMYVSKESHNGVSTYCADEDGYSRNRLSLFGDLRRAIDEGELVLHYQPKVDLRTGDVCGAEALVRWEHPQRGLVPPDEFIPVAERTGLIRALSAYVLRTAAEQCAAWRRMGLDLSVAVNLSARDLHDMALPGEVERLLTTLSLPASALELEITESTIMADPARAMDVVRRLHEMGVRLAIDDFGTGYSSLAYLKRLPVDDIKIDKSFVLEMHNDEHDLAIVRSTIELARNLGLEVVAEGVESDDALRRLGELGCHRAQGYLIARPAPPDVFTAWLTARAGAAAPTAELPSLETL